MKTWERGTNLCNSHLCNLRLFYGFIAAGLACTHESNSSMACHETRPPSMPVLEKQPLITAASASFEAPCQTRGPHSAQRTRRSRRKADPFALRAELIPSTLNSSRRRPSQTMTDDDSMVVGERSRAPRCIAGTPKGSMRWTFLAEDHHALVSGERSRAHSCNTSLSEGFFSMVCTSS